MDPPPRRLAAVWFADIVGYTALSSRDEDAALRLVALLQEVARKEIESHGGTLVKSLGDGVLAQFDSTATAIRAALALRDAFAAATRAEGRSAQLRIGLHVGDVVVSPSGDVFGDGVNVASRLHGEARPGRVVVSQDVWRQCRSRTELRFEPLGSRRLKGIADPIDAYEVEKSRGRDENDAGSRPAADGARIWRRFSRTWLVVGAAVMIAAVVVWSLLARGAGPASITDRSVAVLPFETLGSEQATAFTEGIQIGILTRLSSVAGLDVISRTSVLSYRATDKTLPEIARELGVAWVLRGTVQEVGDQVLVNARLVDARHDRQIWASEYRRRLTAENVFDIQSQISVSIIDALQARLSRPEAERIEQVPTGSLEAYRLYVEGREKLDERTQEGMRDAASDFEHAIARDSTYALAWVGLADARGLLYSYGYAPADSVLPDAEAAVRRALELDSGLAQAHTSLGLLQLAYHHGPASVQELERAVALQPSYAEAHNWLSYARLLLGRPSQALDSARRAVEEDPLSPEAVSNLALSYLATGDVERALVEARRVRSLDPAWTTGSFYEGLAQYRLGRYGETRSVLRNLSVPWTGSGPQATLALARVAAGDSSGARTLLTEISRAGDPFAAGLVHAALGELDLAFSAFREARTLGDWPTLAVRYLYPDVWRRVDDDPRYDELVATADRSWGLTAADR